MPHNSHSSHSRHGGSSGDDLGSTDEVKIFKDEGDREEEKISSENLLEEKSSLIDLTESEEKSAKLPTRPDHSPVFSKIEPHASSFNMGYLVSPYAYSNGGAGGLPVTMANKIGLPPFFCHNGDPLTTPPPAHCGIPPYQLDPKAMGLTRPTIYSIHHHAYPMLSPDMTPSWHTPSVYSAASSFRSPYPSSLPINTTLPSDFPFRFSPNLLPSVHTSPHHVLNSHPAIVTPGPKQDYDQESTTNHRYSRNLDTKTSSNLQGNECKENSNDKKKSHIKKPLNAFMLYMKEMRAKVVAECTLKESAAINQILGRRWHELSRDEQSKYYEKARQERQLHMELYPGWSARDNYGYVSKKKKRKKDRSPADSGGNNMKKCRARFGLDQQNQWCKPCRRKKKCIRYMEAIGSGGSKDDRYHELDDLDGHMSDDNLGSCGSVDDNHKTPEDDNESLNQSLSSPGCLSGLSSLQSPSTSLASPLNLLASPATPVTASLLASVEHHQPQQQQLHHQQLPLQTLQPQHMAQNSLVAASAAAAAAAMQRSLLHQQQHQTRQQQHQNHLFLLSQQQAQPASQQQQQLLANPNQPTTAAVPGVFDSANTASTISMLQSANTVADVGECGSNSTNTSTVVTTSGPSTVSISDRTMRTLLNPSPAMLLSNRFSHSNNNFVQSAISLLQPGAANAASTKATNGYSHNYNSSITKALSGGGVNTPSSSTSSSPAGDSFYEKSAPAHRNPIGVNPRDINNPLSINQLTKRGDCGSSGSGSANSSSNSSSSINTTTNNNSSQPEKPAETKTNNNDKTTDKSPKEQVSI